MASSPKPKATFATLPREIRDEIYKNMLTESKKFDISLRAADYGLPEDVKTLRATHQACRKLPRFAREAFEMYFRIKTFIVCSDQDLCFLNRPVYYVKNRGFQPLMMFVQAFEVRLDIRVVSTAMGHQGLCNCFRDLLACPGLRSVTVQVEMAGIGDWASEVPQERDLANLDIILIAATAIYQKLKAKLGGRLRFATKFPLVAENIKAWEERMGKAAAKQT